MSWSVGNYLENRTPRVPMILQYPYDPKGYLLDFLNKNFDNE